MQGGREVRHETAEGPVDRRDVDRRDEVTVGVIRAIPSEVLGLAGFATG
jgi:hypothetical protein